VGVEHLHAHFAHGPASVARYASLLIGVPYSFTAHAKDIYTSPPGLLATKIDLAKFVVTCTDYNSEYLRSLASPATRARIHRIYHGVDLSKFDAGSREVSDTTTASQLTVLSIGRLVEKKGLPYLIEAIADLRAQGYPVHLKIVGGGPVREALASQIQHAGLTHSVTLLGPRPQEALLDLYPSAAVFALPCIVTENGDRDGIPNVLVEAMRMGVPVVSTCISGIPELVINQQTGLLVPPRDARALAEAIARLLDDHTLADRLVAQAAQHVRNEFDLTGNTARLRKLFETAVA
jgi:glycosyltransferase involved in cell wall biosynthesis